MAEGATHTMDGANGQAVAISFKGGHSANGGLGVDDGACQTMQSKMSSLEPTVAVAYDGYNQTSHDEVTFPLRTENGSEGDDRTVKVAIGINMQGGSNTTATVERTDTITAATNSSGNNKTVVAIGIGRDAFNSGTNAQMAQSISREVQPPITAKGPGGGMREWRTTKGDDVMPTLDTRLAAQVDKQMERNGSYLCGPIQ